MSKREKCTRHLRIRVPESQHKALHQMAAQLGVPAARLVRGWVTDNLRPEVAHADTR